MINEGERKKENWGAEGHEEIGRNSFQEERNRVVYGDCERYKHDSISFLFPVEILENHRIFPKMGIAEFA